MLKLFVVLVTVFGILSAFFVTSALGRGVDGFSLAIRHFDPEHKIGLEANGPEVKFMRAALRYAREQFPEIRSIHNPDARPRSTVGCPGVGNTLKLVAPLGSNGEKELTAEKKVAIGTSIAAGCLNEKRLHEIPFSSGRSKTRQSSSWSIQQQCEGILTGNFVRIAK